MTATLSGKIQNQQIILDSPIPQEYNGAAVSIRVSKNQAEMSVEERIKALEALCGRGGRVFPDDATAYIREMRDNDRF